MPQTRGGGKSDGDTGEDVGLSDYHVIRYLKYTLYTSNYILYYTLYFIHINNNKANNT